MNDNLAWKAYLCYSQIVQAHCTPELPIATYGYRLWYYEGARCKKALS